MFNNNIVHRENMLADIISVFEVFLKSRNVSVPCFDPDESNGKELIYGYDYAELSDNLEDKLISLGLINDIKH